PNGCSSLSSVRIVDSSGRDVTQYYSLVVIEGTLTVTPRPITVTTQSDSFMYDDQYHSFTQISVGGSYGLVKGHTASAGYATEFRFVSDSGENHVEVLIRSGSRDVTHNYEIEFNYGIVEVIPRVLNVQTNSISAMYDDTGHYDHRISVTGANRLCTGHVIVVDTDSAIYVDAVTNGKNEVLFHIMHGEEDRTENYEIRGNYGSVNISKRPITVTSASFEGVYDGLDHGGGLSLVPGEYGLCYGHALNVISAPEFKNVVTGGINLIEFGVVKFGVEDVTKNYDITFNPGTITITHRYVYVNTGSDTWYYDGKAHHCHDYETVDSEFVRFHDVRIPRFTSITEVGTEYNVLEFEVFDEEGISVTSNYIIAIEEYGILQVLESNVDIPDEPPVPDDPPILPAPLPTPAPGDVDGGPLEENGNLGLPLKPDVDSFDPELGDPAVAYYIFSTTTGQVYLKLKSFGDLNGNTWGEADDYYMLFDNFSAAYLTSKALESAGKGEGFMRITSMFNQYVLPYYASTKDVDPQISDVHPIGDASQEYMLYYYNWSYTPGAYTLPEEAAEYEREYSKFVHDNYLTINKSTLEYLQGVITAQGFDINDPYVISKVAAYIQNAASYNLKYDRALDQSEDIVIAFLDQYKEGICQHYATAATMLYRALGIPARYTIGYVGSTIAGEVSEIYSNQGHAWVEVYINGLGWVNVEVTGSGSGLDIPGGNHTETKKETIVVTPLYQHKIYDGKPLVAENKISELDPVLAELLANDYRYEVTVEGYQYGVGKSNSYVTSFTLYDPSGNEVNDRYNIVFEDGLLEVAYGIISIYLYEKTYEYNGHSFSYGLDEYAIISMPANVRFEMHSINISLKNVGSLSSNEINKDIRKYLTYSIYSGNSSTDVWENYIVTVVNFMDGGEYVPIKVNPREIVVATGSESKYYDSKPLTNDTYYVSKGQLADGHRLNIEVIGSITAVGSVSNTVDISSLVIYDADGNIVTKNYNVVGYELGTLEVMK
ncbi:MAG: transglutaminase domain-containing protein, partial [Clostridia bacterium]|nr:transglutaminase domain-containing protein [Clostridia bacterium]